jgi:FtsH-binding integral membrane protein
MSSGAGLLWFLAAFACLFGIRVAKQRSEQLAIGLVFGFGLPMGLAVATTIASYASTNPQAVWQSGGATALFIAGFRAAGYATRRDLSALARVLFFALIAHRRARHRREPFDRPVVVRLALHRARRVGIEL